MCRYLFFLGMGGSSSKTTENKVRYSTTMEELLEEVEDAQADALMTKMRQEVKPDAPVWQQPHFTLGHAGPDKRAIARGDAKGLMLNPPPMPSKLFAVRETEEAGGAYGSRTAWDADK
eukprot:TRINITY_DN13347_c0_g1_i1.p1 TRINITY_DN13347_c0_g1~~TRINITY_DN13347_c0_g1_i1.p1  ORF type:complete len:118 (-),score=27.84 TRINITY_DN13347_c0_g1_i1:218-571(-)